MDKSEADQQLAVQGQEMETFNLKGHMGTPQSESLSTHSAAWNLLRDLPKARATSEHRGEGAQFKDV